MNEQYFREVCEQVIQSERENAGIGTLSEKTVHAVLKRYLEPDTSFHEIKVGSFYADICTPDEIIEIQTAHFDKLRRKLTAFLPEKRVNVVYPVPHKKTLRWIDPETGEVTAGRKSPKLGSPYEVFRELYKIRNFLTHENLHITILLIDMEEYRFLNGWSRDRKRGSVRAERLPQALAGEYHIDGVEDYSLFVPDTLPENFVSVDFRKATKLSQSAAQTALLLLHEMGAVKRVGKKGNAWIYERNAE